MKPRATARKPATGTPRARVAAPAGTRPAATRTGAAAAAARRPATGTAARRPTTGSAAATRKTVTMAAGTRTAPAAKKPYVIKKPKWRAPPRPSMRWICYDFTIKMVRGVCLGIAIGLVLTVILPWILDMGFALVDYVQDVDLAFPDMSNYTSLMSWNETSSRLWRVDQSSQNLRAKITKAPKVDPKVLADQQLLQSFPQYDRSITLVHVGHSGGRSLIQSCPRWNCKDQYPRDDQKELGDACVLGQFQRAYPNAFSDINYNNMTKQQRIQAMIPPLVRQAKYYVHLGSVQQSELQNSTSFLLTLRNPVDRILAIFADSHPLACINPTAPELVRPWGCVTRDFWNLPDTQQYSFYHHCFPKLGGVEDFAQAVLSPWPNITGEEKLVQTPQQQVHDCRWLSREMVLGGGDTSNTYHQRGDSMTAAALTPLAPHMHYNYEYYAQETLLKYPEHEVLAVRYGSELLDLQLLYRLMSPSRGKSLEETFVLPPAVAQDTTTTKTATPKISPEAYAKLCCVLENEIDIYETILQKVMNLPQYAKDETMDALRRKCGLSERTAWAQWRVQCKNQMEMDSVLLTP